MKKILKLIATSTLLATMFIGTSIPAMAFESKETISEGTVQTRAMVSSYYYEGSITQGKTLSPLSLNGAARTIKYSVNGSGGIVILRITNRNTGDSRSFTTIGDGSWDSITYVSSMSPGIWDVKVESATGSGHNKVWIEFHN